MRSLLTGALAGFPNDTDPTEASVPSGRTVGQIEHISSQVNHSANGPSAGPKNAQMPYSFTIDCSRRTSDAQGSSRFRRVIRAKTDVLLDKARSP